ncbi:MAG: protein kinase [Candidatus Wallbacteria bacterium]|nr:protein kinase [Candidatus Wallbacteria bacterium]
MSEEIPSSLGRYIVTGKVGSGGMGLVLSGLDPQLGREVAIKVLWASLRGVERMHERFRREALALARLTHPNIVRVFDVGEQDEMLYYVMELLQGTPLAERTTSLQGASQEEVAKLFSIKDFLDVFTPLSDALVSIHSSGVLHRDIKPANIIDGVRERGPVLTDFGLARIEKAEALTGPGTLLGTGFYMAPEQIRGKTADPPCDVYALGSCMFEYVTARVPFSEIPYPNLLIERRRAQLPPLGKIAPWVPEPLAKIIDRAVKLDRSVRHPDAGELRRELSELAAALAKATERSASPRPKRREKIRITKTVVPVSRQYGAVFAFAGLLLLGAIGLGLRRSHPPQVAPAAALAPAKPSLAAWKPIPEVPITLAHRQPGRNRLSLAEAGGVLLAAWQTDDGGLHARRSADGGHSWSTPPLDGTMPVHPDTQIGLIALTDRFYLVFSPLRDRKPATGAGLPVRICWSAPEAATWSAPETLGVAANGSELNLAAGALACNKNVILAVWESPDKSSLGLAWGDLAAGEWTRSMLFSPRGDRVRHVAAALTAREGFLVWHAEEGSNLAGELLSARTADEGRTWSTPALVVLPSGAIDRNFPALAADGTSIVMQWSELAFPGFQRPMAAVSND